MTYTTNRAGIVKTAQLPRFSQVAFLVASGNWTVPPGTSLLRVTCLGAGGGGCTTTKYAGGGGGGFVRKVIATRPGAIFAYSTGAGGANGNPGAVGGNTTFDTLAAGGGAGGTNAGAGGVGGTATGGDINYAGGAGGTCSGAAGGGGGGASGSLNGIGGAGGNSAGGAFAAGGGWGGAAVTTVAGGALNGSPVWSWPTQPTCPGPHFDPFLIPTANYGAGGTFGGGGTGGGGAGTRAPIGGGSGGANQTTSYGGHGFLMVEY